MLSAKKYALIIAIGDYNTSTGWSAISSENDIPIIKGSLLKHGFQEEDISILKNDQATKKGIITAVNQLKSKLSKGDIVVIHYSGHGQQIFDDNGDEVDNLDEALVPYDAWAKFNAKYKGENHLRDDEIQVFTNEIRNILGNEGQLLMILDSCHSGSATRGPKARGGVSAFIPSDWNPTMQNENKGSGMFEKSILDKNAAPFVVISGASANELNYEYEGVGSLSYAFAKAMNDLGKDFTYRSLFSTIATHMNVIAPNQKPTIEGDIDYKLFKGEYVKQNPYFEINKITLGNTILTINGGKINQIFENTTVFIMPSGSNAADKKSSIGSGIITKADFSEAIVKLNAPLKDSNTKKYWVFVDQPSYGDLHTKVYIDPNLRDNTIKKGIIDFLSKNNLGQNVENIENSDITIEEKNERYILSSSKGFSPIAEINPLNSTNTIEDITAKIFSYSQGNYLKSLSIKNNNYSFEFKLLPVEYDRSKNEIDDKKNNTKLDENGVLQFAANKDSAILEIKNTSNKNLYVSIVEINTAGEVNPFFPNRNCNLSDEDRRLAPGKTMVFKNCIFSFGPPYERLVLKGFASDKPLNFQTTINTRGNNSNHNNPLEQFLQKSYIQSRGSSSEQISGSLDGFSTEYIYDIVP